jgi:hypothetical protein
MRYVVNVGQWASTAFGVTLSVCLLLGAPKTFAQSGVCRNSNSDPKNPNCSGTPAPPRVVCKCQAQVQVDGLIKEANRTLSIVKQQLNVAAGVWALADVNYICR